MSKIKANMYLSYKNASFLSMAALLATITLLIIITFSVFSLGSSFKGSSGSVTYVGLITFVMFLYSVLDSITAPKASINYSLRMGSTRKEYFLGSLAYYIVISLVFSLINTILFALENIIFKYLGINQLNNFSTIFEKLTLLSSMKLTIDVFLIFLTTFAVVTMFSHLAYIIGEYGWFIIIASFIIIFAIALPALGIPVSLMFPEAIRTNWLSMSVVNLIIAVICFTTSYFIIRRTQLR